MLRQKQKSCDEINNSNGEIIIKKQNPKSSASLHQYMLIIRIQVIRGQGGAMYGRGSDFKNQRTDIDQMPLPEDDKSEAIHQSSNPEVQVPASRHTDEPDKVKCLLNEVKKYAKKEY